MQRHTVRSSFFCWVSGPVPKIAKELGPLHVQRLKLPGLYAVGGVTGLQLQITDNGAKSWVLRAKVGAKRRDIGLGGYPTVTLAQARDRAREARDQIFRGIDPVEERRRRMRELAATQAVPTFDRYVRDFLADKTAEFRNAKHAEQWRSTLETYASPVMGRLPVSEIDLSHVVRVLKPIWTTKTETASRLRGRIEAVLAGATVSGYRKGDNPARWKGHLDAVLPKPTKVANVEHHAALPYSEIPAFVARLRAMEGIGPRALEFAILTVARSGEARGTRPQEIDLEAAVWTIPAARMKAGKEHRVPLTQPVRDLLRALPKSERYVFAAPRGGQLSDMTLTAVLRRMKVDVTVHGFRSTFRDWAGETTGFPREVIEHALAHQLKDKAEAAYARGTLFEKRRHLMEAWTQYCTGCPPGSNVIPIQSRSAA